MIKRKVSVPAVILAIFFLFQNLTGQLLPTFAAVPVNIEKSITLALHYQDGEKKLSDASFSLYQVGECSADGRLSLSDGYAGYQKDLEKLDSSGWRNLARSLAESVMKNNVSPVDSGRTDSEGILVFPNLSERLRPGLYLIVGKKHFQNEKVYATEPFLTGLPVNDILSGEWVYEAAIYPKQESRPIGDSDSDNGGSGDESGGGGSTRNPHVPDEQVEELTRIEPFPTPFANLLPQTGTLWWWAIVLACLGSVIFFIGLIYNRKNSDEAS